MEVGKYGRFAYGNLNSDDELEQDDDFWNDPELQNAFGLKPKQRQAPTLIQLIDPVLVALRPVSTVNEFSEFDEPLVTPYFLKFLTSVPLF